MQIGKVSQAVGLRDVIQAQSPNLSGHPSKSHSHEVRESKARSRDKSQDPTEFARALERAMTK